MADTLALPLPSQGQPAPPAVTQRRQGYPVSPGVTVHRPDGTHTHQPGPPPSSELRQHGMAQSQNSGQTVPGSAPLLRGGGGQEPLPPQRTPNPAWTWRLPSPPALGLEATWASCQPCSASGSAPRVGGRGQGPSPPPWPPETGFAGRAARSPAQTGPGATSLTGRRALCLLHPIRSCVTRPPWAPAFVGVWPLSATLWTHLMAETPGCDQNPFTTPR